MSLHDFCLPLLLFLKKGEAALLLPRDLNPWVQVQMADLKGAKLDSQIPVSFLEIATSPAAPRNDGWGFPGEPAD